MFCCLYIPDFPAAALLRTADDITREQPFAVLEGNPPLINVVSMNARAREAGIYAGMTKLQAEACAGIVLRQRSAVQEQMAHETLLDCAYTVSPRAEATAKDIVIVDISGLTQLFGSPEKIARMLTSRVKTVGMEARVAVGPNPDVAVLAARGFTGITVLEKHEVARRLGHLPTDVLPTTAEVIETLERWGVRNLRALTVLPPVALTERLGQEGLRLQKLARGEHVRPLVPTQESFHFEERYEFEDAVDLLEPLSFVLNRMLEQLCTRLNARALASNELKLELELEVNEDIQLWGEQKPANDQRPATNHLYTRTLRLPVPMLESRVFLKLLQLDLKAHPPEWPVKKVSLTAEAVRPRTSQNAFFMPLTPQPERLEITLARIRGVVADRNDADPRVGSPALLDVHRADAFVMKKFSPELLPGKTVPQRSIGPGVPLAALRIFRPPLPAKVELKDGAPTAVIANAQRGTVVGLAGPWRTSGEWWTEHAWSREEWDVALRLKTAKQEEFVLYRVFRDMSSSQWFVEASYD
jgi:protein ImuB